MRDHDPYDIEGQEARQLETQTLERVAASMVEADLVWLMSGKRGRRIVHRILRDAQIDESSFSSHYGEMSRREGRKELARGLRRLIDRLCPEQYVAMMQENERAGTS